MLDLVPLARAGWEVAHRHREPRLLGEGLKLGLPQTRPIAVATSGVGRDEELLCLGIDLLPHVTPPSPDRLDRKLSGVVIHAYTHPTFVSTEIVDPIGDCLA